MSESSRSRNGHGQTALQGFGWQSVRDFIDNERITQSELRGESGTRVLVRLEVRPKAFPTGLPMPIWRCPHAF